jgi:16S rRNA processing protein RimM
MNSENYFELGYIIKPHGLAGEVQVYIESETPEEYSELESVFVEINKKLIPFFIDSISINRKKAIVKFEDVDSVENAADFSGKKLFLPAVALPELEEDQFYYHDIIGYTVVDAEKGPLGPIREVYENPGHDLLGIEYQGKEVLIPIVDDFITKVDHQEKKMLVKLPEGLLDIYME